MIKKQLENLPSPPGVAVQILELYAQPDIDLDELKKIISADPALTARIIKYANSASFARRHAPTSLMQAIMVIGESGLKLIALSFSLTESGSNDENSTFPFEQFWCSSLATAVCAKKLFSAIGQDEEIGFLLGLLMNVGQLAMACEQPELYQTIIGNSATNDPCLIQRELETFGEDRYKLADSVLEAMGFPETVYSMLEVLDNVDGDELTDDSAKAQALVLANQMSYFFLETSPDTETVRTFKGRLIELTSMSPEQTELLFDQALESYAELSSILAYESRSKKTLREIEMEAKASIIEETLSIQLNNMQVTHENKELKSIAFSDPLTGLGNRRQYESVLQTEMERCTRLKRPLSFVIFDIDHFKRINDTYGHAAGDAVLEQVAERLNSHLRCYDFLFRIGGEEFALILTETNLEDCRVVSERLRQCIAKEPFQLEDQKISVTVSLGGTMFDTHSAVSKDELFKVADSSLYSAKRAGRNRGVFKRTSSPTADAMCQL